MKPGVGLWGYVSACCRFLVAGGGLSGRIESGMDGYGPW